MKKLYTLLTAVILTISAFAQAPEKMSYQAVVRDTDNTLISDQLVGMQLSILQGSASGSPVYVEMQTPSTNTNGLVSVEIGAGTVVSGTFNDIDWNNGPYFIKTETDPTGGTTYNITGTSQLMSVPYALHAKTADSITGDNNKHYIGELFGGGIVYYVYDNGLHGLIASLDDIDDGNGMAWSGNTSTSIGITAQSFYDGAANTLAIVAQDNTENKAATSCDSYSNDGFDDWYLPSNWELNLLHNSAYVISNILANDSNEATNPLHPENVFPTFGRYWSSTEDINSFAWYYDFGGSSISDNKSTTMRVRAIRSF